ncbi:hypothetical protein [Pseudomonas sp. MPB26]|uniref:hypothetical protein n=1 Tax=Pseudomonas sp. MPB26 TaxID=3388491 RepID=UPI0039853068
MPASPRQIHIEQIHTVFSEPPTLEAVAQDSAQAWLDQYLPAWRFNAAHTLLVATERYQSLAELVIERMAAAKPTLLVVGYHVVVQRSRETYTRGGPSLEDTERLINSCGTRLLGLFCERLQAWWRQALPVDMTRWGYLADELLELLYDSPAPPGMTAQRFAEVFPKSSLHAIRPDRLWRLGLPVYTVHLRNAADTQTLPLLLISHAPYTLLFSLASGVHLLDNVDAVQPLLSDYVSPLLASPVGHWFTQRVYGDPFDALAAAYLARQLQEIASLDTRVPRPVQAYQQLLGYILDTKRWFVPALSAAQRALRPVLPLWLAAADSDDSLAGATLLHGLVLAAQQDGSQDFLEGIEPLEVFAASRLHECLKQDEPRAANLVPGEISLSFTRVIAAPVPVPGGFIAGEVHTFTLTLTELALENLGGLPHAPKSIQLKGAAAPDWLTYDLLKACVTRVDIGQAYPALLKKHLIDDATDATRRQGLFSRRWRAQLPLQALQWKIQGLRGLTRMGFRRLNAAVQADKARRVVEGQAVALWPLAFKARPSDSADVVEGHFVIGPRHGEEGPHVLYRPLFSPVVLEYSSQQALFAAIQAKGELQDNVLAWLAPRRQSLYANDGFRQPHIRYFLQGDEFTTYTTPQPVELSRQVSDVDPAQQVFAATAKALVTLADRQTVSNAEQRWASLKQAGWLLFNSLMPLISGPLMLGGWLLQVMDSARNDLPALASADEQARSAAVLDLLVNLMAILAHQAAPHDAHASLELDHPVFAPLALPEPVLAESTRIAAPVSFEAPASWANARDTLTASLQTRLNALSLKTLAKPWPKALPGAERSGPWQGLRRDTTHKPPHWQALVRGQQFRVRIEQGRVRVISADGTRTGPWLKSLGQGAWDFDLQLRLRGGADRNELPPPDRQALQLEYKKAGLDRTKAQLAMEIARKLVDKPEGVLDPQQRSRAWFSYLNGIKDKVRAAQEEVRLLKCLRELGPRPRYEEELCQGLETIILSAQLMDAHNRTQLRELNQRLRPLLDADSDDMDPQAHAELGKGMREVADNHHSSIYWRLLEQRYVEDLQAVPRLGRDKARALTEAIPARPSVLDLQALQVTTLWSIAIDVPGEALDDDFFAGMSATIDRARRASCSQADMQQLQSSDAERIALLDSIDHVYAQTDDRIEYWRAMEPDKFDLPYLQRLQELLATLHRRVEQDLSELLQPPPEPAPTPAPKPASTGRRKKIIHTRNRDIYVAQLGDTGAELHDAGGQVVGTFTEAEDGVFDLEVKPEPVRPDPELGALLKKADGLLRDVDKAIANAEAMAESANEPASLQGTLQYEARRRTMAADAIAGKLRGLDNARLAAVQLAKARLKDSELRTAAVRLETAGLNARIRASRGKVLTQDDVEFLHANNAVTIHRQGERVGLRGRRDDYLQVYEVTEVSTGQPLCFAHFHYARRNGPDDHFTAAHLKIPEQERLGRQAQAEVEAQAFARMRLGYTGRVPSLEIHRSQIQLPLARRLFFSAD